MKTYEYAIGAVLFAAVVYVVYRMGIKQQWWSPVGQ